MSSCEEESRTKARTSCATTSLEADTQRVVHRLDVRLRNGFFSLRGEVHASELLIAGAVVFGAALRAALVPVAAALLPPPEELWVNTLEDQAADACLPCEEQPTVSVASLLNTLGVFALTYMAATWLSSGWYGQ